MSYKSTKKHPVSKNAEQDRADFLNTHKNCCVFLGTANFKNIYEAFIYRCSLDTYIPKDRIFYSIGDVVRQRPIEWVEKECEKNNEWTPFWKKVYDLSLISKAEKNQKKPVLANKICDRCSKYKFEHYNEYKGDVLRCPKEILDGALVNSWVYVNEDEYGKSIKMKKAVDNFNKQYGSESDKHFTGFIPEKPIKVLDVNQYRKDTMKRKIRL